MKLTLLLLAVFAAGCALGQDCNKHGRLIVLAEYADSVITRDAKGNRIVFAKIHYCIWEMVASVKRKNTGAFG